MRLEMRNLFVAFAGAVALAVCSMPVQASTVLFNSLGGAIVGADSLGFYGPLGQSFSTGGTPITLTDVKVSLDTPFVSDDPTVSLFSDNNTSPGTLLSTLGSFTASPTAPTVYDVSGLSVALAANTRYWIEVSSTNTGIGWDYTFDTSGTGVSGQYYYYNGGVSPNLPYLMEVQGVTGMTSVPEPPVLPLFALGFLAMVFFGRRRFAR